MNIEEYNRVENEAEQVRMTDQMSLAEMFSPDMQFANLVKSIIMNGSSSDDRTGTGTYKIVGAAEQFSNVSFWFPILEGKKVNFDAVINELCWFVSGSTNIKGLNSKIWDEWADADGNLGPVYGKQWRKWRDTQIIFTGEESNVQRYNSLKERGYVERGSYPAGDTGYDEIVMYKEHDQLQNCIDTLRTNPDSRRIICSSWNVGDLPDMALMPCHLYFQFVSDSDVDNRKFDLDVHEELYGERPARVLDMVYLMRSH